MFARMRGASKTTDELRNFWNERCIIEEEYATRLAKLAKAPIGGDEIGYALSHMVEQIRC